MILSILIPTLESRKHLLARVYANLDRQIKQHGLEKEIEILMHLDKGEKSVGQKRNELVEKAQGKYVAHIDDDDDVSPFYIKTVYKCCLEDKDCVSMIGIMSTDGYGQKRFNHSIKYTTYFEQNREYFRPPNHLNPIKKEIAVKFKFPETSFGEDTDWAMQLCNAGVLKTEAVVTVPLYFYLFRTRK